MKKDEFLRILRGKITGAMDQTEVEAQIKYYSEYIDQLIAAGKTEEEAVEELGDPLLIAKTLDNAVEGGYLDSDYQGGSQAKEFREDRKDNQSSQSTYERNTYDRGYYQSGNRGNVENSTKNKIIRGVVLAVGIIVILACIYLFFRVCFGIGSCILGGFLPIIVIVIILGLLFSFFRRF